MGGTHPGTRGCGGLRTVRERVPLRTPFTGGGNQIVHRKTPRIVEVKAGVSRLVGERCVPLVNDPKAPLGRELPSSQPARGRTATNGPGGREAANRDELRMAASGECCADQETRSGLARTEVQSPQGTCAQGRQGAYELDSGVTGGGPEIHVDLGGSHLVHRTRRRTDAPLPATSSCGWSSLIFRTRQVPARHPSGHSTRRAAIRGHMFCSFLSPDQHTRRSSSAWIGSGFKESRGTVRRDELQASHRDGNRPQDHTAWRHQTTGHAAASVFRAVGVHLPMRHPPTMGVRTESVSPTQPSVTRFATGHEPGINRNAVPTASRRRNSTGYRCRMSLKTGGPFPRRRSPHRHRAVSSPPKPPGPPGHQGPPPGR